MMSKKVKVVIGVVLMLVFVLAGVGGWFLHSSMVKKDYEAAWAGYEKEVKAWSDVNERYQVLEPVCGELASEAECEELKTAGEQAGKATEKLSLDLKKAKSASKEEKQKLENATKDIKTEREKFEPAVEKIEKAAEATIQDKFAPVLEEAEKKANEASGLVGSLKGKVKDENTLKTLESAASELSSACGKWKGKDIPTGQEGVQAYLELKRLTLTCNDAVTKANESHIQWQKEEDQKVFSSLAGSYVFTSGAGGWDTSLTIKSDGSFSGTYRDSELGSTDYCDKCSGGVMYVSDFSGRFSQVRKVSEYEYKATIESINLAKPVGYEELVGNIMHIYSEPSGMMGENDRLAIGKEMTFYLPGMPTSNFSHECVNELGENEIERWILMPAKDYVISGNILRNNLAFVTETCHTFVRD